MTESMHLLTGAYAADALDDAERAAFEAHLGDCPDCTAEVRSLLDTTARLGAAEAVTPPPRLKASVLAQVATTRQLSPELGSARADPDPGGQDEVVVAMRAGSRPRAPRWLAAAAVFLVVLAVGLAALLVQADRARSQLTATQQEVAKVLTAADAQAVTRPLTGGGTATIVASASTGTSVLLASGVPAAPAGHTYQLWYLGGPTRAPVSAGTFAPDASGHAAVVLSGPIAGASAIGMTVEPAGGSGAPTNKPVLAVPVPG